MFGPIKNRNGEQLDLAYCSGAERSRVLVILGHGVTANKDRSWALALAKGLDELGFATLRFSFSGNGRSQGDFKQSTILKEVNDLKAILNAVSGFQKVVFVGHSMAGAVGVLCASADPRIDVLVSLAGMVHVQDFAQRKFGSLTPDNDLMWDKPECPLSSIFMNEMSELKSVVDKGSEIKQPWLLVHGSGDSVVPLQDSIDIHSRAHLKASLKTMDGADHLFSGEHEAKMVTIVSDWLVEKVAVS
ncbi:MAG: alpha/beta fold hydrolase [Planctomycetota bacterium]|nr:alpha/beta fold hydrolase [Planctomycetota bacterium]